MIKYGKFVQREHLKIITHSICKLFLNLVDTILFRFIFTVNFHSSFGFLPFLGVDLLFFSLMACTSSETRGELEPKIVLQLLLGSSLGTRPSAIGQFYPSPETVPKVFAKVNLTSFLRVCKLANFSSYNHRQK